MTLLTVMPMFDWPEQSQTSPERTSLSSIVLLPLMVIVNGPPALGVFSFSFQSPSAVAVAAACSPQDAATEIFSPGFAQPQNVAVVSRCTTMLSLNGKGSRTSARAPAAITTNASNITSLFILISFILTPVPE